MKNFKSYLKELTIVTIGVLIALLISNIKENRQARIYHQTSLETIYKEVDYNHQLVTTAIEKHTALRDTIAANKSEQKTLSDLIFKVGGLHGSYLKNTGLDFYEKNEIHKIDFDLMSQLINMRSTSQLIDLKTQKLMDYLYPNLFADTEESKQLVLIYLDNLLGSENQLQYNYEAFMKEYIEPAPNKVNLE